MTIELIPDQAIGEFENDAHDILGFESYARVLAQAAKTTPGPFTIGVLAKWGMGKTSLLRLTEQNLASDPNVITVWFNAWRYEREEHPIIPLAATIVHALKEQARSKKVAGWGEQLGEALRKLAAGFAVRAKIGMPGVAGVEAMLVPRTSEPSRKRDALLADSVYHGAFATLDGLQLPPDVRMVVFVDDLDRCLPHNAIELLESIKLVLSQRGVIFVLGVAQEVLERYLEHRYRTEYGIEGTDARTYLEKIIQLPFPIPPPADRIDALCSHLLSRQPAGVAEALEPIVPIVARALGSSPRATIRFINNTLIDAAIGQELGADLIEYFAIARALQHANRELFILLADDSVAQEVSQWDHASPGRNVSGEGRVSRVAEAMEDMPELRHLLLGTDAGKSWLCNADRRKASIDFLIRHSRLESRESTEEEANRFDVLFSYSSRLRHLATKIVEGLTEAGLSVRLLEDSELTEIWDRRTLDTATVMCVCVGQGSDEVDQRRYSAIRRRRDLRIISVILPGATVDDVPTAFRRHQRVNMAGGITDVSTARLARSVRLALDKIEKESVHRQAQWINS